MWRRLPRTVLKTRTRGYASSTKPRAGGAAPAIAFAFDIDGVLIHGPKTLPEAKRALSILEGNNLWNRPFPYILMTNGGGKLESERCEELSRKLGIRIETSMFMQSHTIMGSSVLPYLARYAEKPIMVLGGARDTCRHIAHSYGFRNVLIPADVLAWDKGVWPLSSISEEDEAVARRDFDFASEPIHAVMVFHDPRSWGPDTQICLDILRHGSKSRPAFTRGTDAIMQNPPSRPEDDVELIFCNPDLIWRGSYPRPRLGQGGFREALQGVFQALESRRYPAKLLGKPSPETYAHAEEMLTRRRNALNPGTPASFSSAKQIYMIGDNPESDIAGANAAGWNSVLVHTGVYSPGDGPPSHEPTFQASNVEEAVISALRRETS